VSFPDLYNRVLNFVEASTKGAQNPILKGNLSQPFEFRRVSLAELMDQWSRSLSTIKRDMLMMRKIHNRDLLQARNAALKATELFPQEPGPWTGLALATLYDSMEICRTNSSDKCEDSVSMTYSLLERGVSLSQNGVDRETNNWNMYQALLAACAVNVNLGKFELAIEACQKAIPKDRGAVRARFVLAKAYLAIGQWIKASDLLDAILDPDRRSDFVSFLTPEEWGKAVVWRACLLHGDGRNSDALAMLEEYTQGQTPSGIFIKIFGQSPIVDMAFHGTKLRINQASNLPPSRWANEVAILLLGDDNPGEDSLGPFLQEKDIDLNAITCESAYYRGLRMLWYNQSGAPEEFAKAVAGGAVDHVEYWLAKQLIPHEISGH
jgi:tetratricopeptide (TPR) repeat protein